MKCRFDPWVWKIPWSRKWQPIPVLNLVGYRSWDCKKSDRTEHTHTLTHTHRGIDHGIARSQTGPSTHTHTHTEEEFAIARFLK